MTTSCLVVCHFSLSLVFALTDDSLQKLLPLPIREERPMRLANRLPRRVVVCLPRVFRLPRMTQTTKKRTREARLAVRPISCLPRVPRSMPRVIRPHSHLLCPRVLSLSAGEIPLTSITLHPEKVVVSHIRYSAT